MGYTKVLLTFSPLLTETQLTARSHHDFIVWVVETVYNKSMNNVTALIGDNCDTNEALANLFNTPFIGCHSHRFNLAVKLATKEDDPLLSKVNTLMGKFKNLKLAAGLRELTDKRKF